MGRGNFGDHAPASFSGSLPSTLLREEPVEDEVKRLAATKETIRELFAKSGNRCAFPGCRHLIIDEAGNFVAQICHIEAAQEGGQRFREGMSNEERRHVSNLMLMCYAHHVVTNDIERYPVERLRQMKADHEGKYTNAAEVIWRSIVDRTTTQSVAFATSLRRMHDVMKWGLTDDQLLESFVEFDEFQKRLCQLPQTTRELLLVLVNRAGEPERPTQVMSTPHEEVRRACGIGKQKLISHVETLVRYNIARSDHEEMLQPKMYLRPLGSGWPVWRDLRTFCTVTGITLQDILVELRLNLLD
jgi:hypothetical protein